MHNRIMKKRLEYTMLIGIIINALTLFLPIVSVTLTANFKHYSENYSIGSLIRLLVPSVLNGGSGALSNPNITLMASMLLYIICWIAGIFTVILVIQSLRAKNVNIFRTISVSVFELLSSIFILIFSFQMKSFAVGIAVEPYTGHVKSSSSIIGTGAALIVLILSFVNIFMLVNIIRSGGQYDELEERDSTPERRSYDQRRPARTVGYDRYEQRNGEPRRSNIPMSHTQPVNLRDNRSSASAAQGQRIHSNTGVIDRYNLPRQTVSSSGRPNEYRSNNSVRRPTAVQPQGSARPIICPSCGARCRSGTRFCNICGERFDSRPITKSRCSGCGASISENDVFCPTCGSIIK